MGESTLTIEVHPIYAVYEIGDVPDKNLKSQALKKSEELTSVFLQCPFCSGLLVHTQGEVMFQLKGKKLDIDPSLKGLPVTQRLGTEITVAVNPVFFYEYVCAACGATCFLSSDSKPLKKGKPRSRHRRR